MTELPHGWSLATLPDLIGIDGVFTDGDWVETKDQDPSGDVRLTQLADIGEGSFRDRSARFMTEEAAARLGCTYLRRGDVLVARMPDPLGRACVFPGDVRPAVTAVDVCILRPGSSSVDPRWLMWWINTPQFRSEIVARQVGTTRKRISRKNLASIRFPVPPLAEQPRIAGAIEGAFSRLDGADDSLRRAQRRLRDLKAALLAAALNGWPERTLGEFAEVFVGTTPSRSAPELWEGDVPWVSSGEVAFCRIHKTRETISPDAVTSGDRLHPPGTVLLAMIGEGKTRGQAAILDVAATHNQNSAAIRLDSQLCAPEWLFYVLMARYEETRRAGSGAQQPALNRARVQALRIPLPPLEDQVRLVEALERQLSLVDTLTTDVDRARRRSATVRRSILEEAYSGELIPQNPDDEPAAVLVERIARQRAAAPTRKRKAQKKAPA
jgi:type I restriction enzyme S subunit